MCNHRHGPRPARQNGDFERNSAYFPLIFSDFPPRWYPILVLYPCMVPHPPFFRPHVCLAGCKDMTHTEPLCLLLPGDWTARAWRRQLYRKRPPPLAGDPGGPQAADRRVAQAEGVSRGESEIGGRERAAGQWGWKKKEERRRVRILAGQHAAPQH